MADKKATLHIEGQAPIELPITEGVLGTPVIDVRTLGSNGFSLLTLVFLPLHPVSLKSLLLTAAKVSFCTVVTQLTN